jgi:pimeloyl-ACP methyl ester carboxylesterase
VAFYEHDNARIQYEEQGSGFPLLLIAPGGMNSTIAAWSKLAPFNPMTEFSNEFRVIAMDQRDCGESTGPLDLKDPWGMFCSDQLGLMDYLGVDRFMMLGCCIGCSYILAMIKRMPDRVVAGVLEQPIGLVPENEGRMLTGCLNWGKELAEKEKGVDAQSAEAFAQQMWGKGDFVYSVTRDFVKSCATPMLVFPGDDLAHPKPIGLEVTKLAPNAELVEEWKSPELMPNTIERVREFLRTHVPS